MQKITLTILFFLILGIPILLQAQENPFPKEARKTARKEAKAKQKASQTYYLVMGLNARYGLSQDFRMSRSTYSGVGIGGILSYRMRSPKIWEEVLMDLSSATHYTSSELGVLDNTYGGIDYRHLRHIKDLGAKEDWHLYLGGSIDTRANVKVNEALGNSGAHWEGISTLNLAGGLQKDFELPLIKKPVSMDYQLAIPLFAYVYRGPAYSLSALDDQNHVFTSIWGLPRVNSELGLTFPFAKNNPNRLRVAYRWDFYGFNDNEIHPVRSAQHGLSLELLINLGKQNLQSNG
ncbi:MAG: hypothetical protein AAF927_28925 [Bacteroidota bacterium]